MEDLVCVDTGSGRIGGALEIRWTDSWDKIHQMPVLYVVSNWYEVIDYGISNNNTGSLMLSSNKMYLSQHIRFKSGSEVWEGL